MTDQLSDQFDIFLNSVTPSAHEKTAALQQAQDIADKIKLYPGVQTCLITGSMVRSTAVRTYSDVDIVAVVDAASELGQKDPGTFVSALAHKLRETESNVQLSENAVRIAYAEGLAVDVLPAIHVGVNSKGDDVYRIGAGNRDGWQTYIPEDQNRVVEEAARSLGSNYKKLVRLCKWWSKTHGQPISSYEIERVAAKAFSRKIPALPRAMIDFFDYATRSMDDASRTTDEIDQSKSIAQEACATWDSGNTTKSIELWRYLLGDHFPALSR